MSPQPKPTREGVAGRSVPEWIGTTPDTRPPPRVRARIFEKYGGVCQLQRRKIRPGEEWQADHIIALVNGGENRESNLWPILAEAHKAKTRLDVKIKSKVARMKAKHLGTYPKPKRQLKSRGFPPSRKESVR